MWIRTKNRQKLVKCDIFEVKDNLLSKQKGVLVGSIIPNMTSVVLAEYDSKKEAEIELDKIQNSIIEGIKVYQL